MRERAQRFDSRQNMKKKNFEVFHYRESEFKDVEVHDHDFYEVYFLLMGDVCYWVEGQVYHLEPGDFLLINPMTLHRPIVAKDSPVYERIVLWINKDYLNSFYDDNVSLNQCFAKVLSEKNNLVRTSSTLTQAEMTSLLAKLVRESYNDSFASSLYADGIFLQFMVELNRIVNESVYNSETVQPSTLVSRILDYINKHYNEDLSLQKLSAKFFVSKYYLSHEFSHSVGTSVYRYIMLKRLTVAKQLLFENMSASDVCFQCGFKDYTCFYRAFKAEYGISPSEIKN